MPQRSQINLFHSVASATMASDCINWLWGINLTYLLSLVCLRLCVCLSVSQIVVESHHRIALSMWWHTRTTHTPRLAIEDWLRNVPIILCFFVKRWSMTNASYCCCCCFSLSPSLSLPVQESLYPFSIGIVMTSLFEVKSSIALRKTTKHCKANFTWLKCVPTSTTCYSSAFQATITILF